MHYSVYFIIKMCISSIHDIYKLYSVFINIKRNILKYRLLFIILCFYLFFFFYIVNQRCIALQSTNGLLVSLNFNYYFIVKIKKKKE